MNEDNFEGSLVLEKLAAIGKQEDFYEAVDSDDFSQAKALLKQAGLDLETISIVLEKMKTSEV